MGYVSYLEDIVDRFNEELLRPAEELLETVGYKTEFAECASRLHVLVALCRKIIAEVREILDLATDPAVDLASQNLGFRKTISRMEVEHAQQIKRLITDHTHRVATLMEQIGHATKEVERLGQELNAERKKRQVAEEAVEHIYMDDNDVHRMTME